MTLLPDHLRAMARAFPDAAAYSVVDTGTMTFGEWEAESNRLARLLAERGVAKGDRVGVYLDATDGLRWMVAYVAIHKAGAVTVPTNTRLSQPELTRLYGHAEPVAVVSGGELAGRARRVLGSLASEAVVVEPPGAVPGLEPWRWSAPGDGVDGSEFQVPVDGEDLADVIYTSGTTGRPKGVAIRHRAAATIPGPPHPSYSGAAWLHSSPLFTFAGVSYIYNPMQLGLQGVYLPRFDSGRWIALVEELRPIFVFLVPSMAQLLVADPRFAAADLTSVQVCSIGSAPLSPATLRDLQEKMPEAAVSNSYGMTEAGAAYCAMPKGEALRRIGSVGQPMAPLEVRIVDEELSELPVGTVGEIVLRMPGREREYFRDEEATAQLWRGGWLHTGDLGRLDEDGYLYIVGREKDIVIRGGNNVHAVDVETVILEHPGVLDAAVVGVPHEVLGEDVAAVVVPRPGGSVDADELRRFCAERLADYKVPRRIEFSDELPRNATGKVVKAKLRESLLDPAP